MTLGYSPSAANTDAFALIAEGWNEMVQEGLTPDREGVCPITAKDEVIYVLSNDGDVVGVLTFLVDPSGVARITLAYVEPSSRKRSVFRAMFEDLRARCAQRGVTRIDVAVSPRNDPGLRAMKTFGGGPQSISYSVLT